MPDFDPYLKWLGIREAQRPVNHYRLLGLDMYESDPDVISSAADRQMAHIRTYQNGARAELSQQILNELAVARRCLLMPDQREAYDQQLRMETTDSTPDTPEPSFPGLNDTKKRSSAARKPQPKPGGNSPVQVTADASMRKKRQQQEKKQMTLSVIGWIGGGVAAVIVSGILISTGVIPGLNQKQPVDPDPIQVANKDSKSSATEQKPKNTDPKPSAVTPPTRNPKTNPRETVDPPPETKPQPETKPRTPNDPGNSTTTQPEIQPAKITDINDPNYVWDQFKLKDYPRASAQAQALISSVKSATASRQIRRHAASSQNGGNSDYELSFQDGILIGLALSPYRDGKIRTIAPITLHQNQVKIGRELGRQYNAKTFLVARPGYAVGEIEVSTQHPMTCLRLIYMKILPNRLDAGDQYSSPWFQKDRVQPVTRLRNATGMPIVGTYGRYTRGSDISSIGFVSARTHTSHGPIANTNQASPSNPTTAPTNPPNEPTTAVVKLDAPTKVEISQARKELLELYADRVRATQASRATRQVREFAELLIADSKDVNEKPAIQYAMLGEAISVSIRIGDLDTSMDAIDDLDKRFVVDAWDFTKTAVDSCANNVSSANAFLYKQGLQTLIDRKIESRQYKHAKWLVDRALTLVRNSSDREAVEKYRKQDRFISELTRIDAAHTRSVKTLETEPDNAEAHEEVGTFQWTIAGNLEQALAHWAQSNDQRLKEIAALESKTDMNNVDQIVSLAEAWENLGKANRTARDRRVLERALDLYRTAQGLAKGVDRRRIGQKRQALLTKINN